MGSLLAKSVKEQKADAIMLYIAHLEEENSNLHFDLRDGTECVVADQVLLEYFYEAGKNEDRLMWGSPEDLIFDLSSDPDLEYSDEIEIYKTIMTYMWPS